MNHFSLNRLKRKTVIKASRIIKGFRYGVWPMSIPKNPQERLILRVVKTMLERNDSFVLYSPETGRVYIHTSDKKYMIVFDKYNVNISNHNYFYNYGVSEAIGSQIWRYAYSRLENDRIKLEEEMFFNEKNFLADVFNHISPKFKKKDQE